MSPHPPSPPPAILPTPPHSMPAINSLLLLSNLARHEQLVDAASVEVHRLLRTLLKASQQGVLLVKQIEGLRKDRERILEDEAVAQHHSRDLLEEARSEMDRQERLSNEIREVHRRAEDEGIDIRVTSIEEFEATTSRKGKGKETRSGEEIEREEREEMLGRQLLYLSHSTRQSEHRVRTLLTTLQATRSSLVSQAALTQLHNLSRQHSSQLDALTSSRERTTAELRTKEKERARAEEKVGECVLDLVLEWDDQRRWKREEKLRRKREGRGFGFGSLLRELEGVAVLLPRMPSSP